MKLYMQYVCMYIFVTAAIGEFKFRIYFALKNKLNFAVHLRWKINSFFLKLNSS